jgi:hypothetical protein
VNKDRKSERQPKISPSDWSQLASEGPIWVAHPYVKGAQMPAGNICGIALTPSLMHQPQDFQRVIGVTFQSRAKVLASNGGLA